MSSQRQPSFKKVEEVFRARFHAAPACWVRAPGRVDLMGSHTDYNLGYVLTLPIDRETWIAARPRQDPVVRVYSMNLGKEAEFEIGEASAPAVGERAWWHYIQGVIEQLRAGSYAVGGWEGVIWSTVPIGAGLSSSAALECAVATLCEQLGGWSLDPVEKACLCQRAENEFVGVPCGILDQYTSCLGREGCALLLDCRDLRGESVPLAGGIRVVICDTRSKRELAASAYRERRAQCEEGARRLGVQALREVDAETWKRRACELPVDVARRCRFIIEENQRVLEMAEALRTGDRRNIQRLCEQSFEGAMELYEIGAPSMVAMMNAMRQAPGVVGARQAGAGFGGCMVALVDEEQVDAFARAISEAYEASTGVRPEIYPVRAAAGAGSLPG